MDIVLFALFHPQSRSTGMTGSVMTINAREVNSGISGICDYHKPFSG